MTIGSARIAWHSIFGFVGAMIGGFFSIRCARYLIRDQRVYPFAIAVVFGGLAGARAAHVIDNWSIYGSDPVKILQFGGGGIGTMGAPIGSTIAGYLAARALRLPIGFMFDVTVIGIALGEAIGRIGDIINGEHHAIACSGLPWCVRYTHPSTLGQSTSVHPTGLYDGVFMAAVFVVLYLYWRRVRGRPPESRVWLAYLLLLGGGRFLLSFLRTDPLFVDGLQEAQVLGLIYFVAALVALPILHARSTQKPLPNPVSGR